MSTCTVQRQRAASTAQEGHTHSDIHGGRTIDTRLLSRPAHAELWRAPYPRLHSNDHEPPELARIAKIKPLSHYDLLEKISEGLFIEAFNSAHDLEGGISAKQAVAGQQRRPMKRSRQLFADGDLLPANEDKTGHVIRAVPKWAIEHGRAYCALTQRVPG
eukprot:scaffold4986_cov117-Isochrysis_galbana.AAC.5